MLVPKMTKQDFLRTHKKIIFVREQVFGFGNVLTIYLDKLAQSRVISVNITVFHVSWPIFEPVFYKTTTQFQVYFFKALISGKCRILLQKCP